MRKVRKIENPKQIGIHIENRPNLVLLVYV